MNLQTNLPTKPKQRPERPFFSSGPCAKHKGWNINELNQSVLGRSHRSAHCKSFLHSAIERTRKILSIPDDYLIAIVPGSDTGAFEMAMWNLLGARGVDAFAFESFGCDWVEDIENQLKIENMRLRKSAYGEIIDLEDVDFNKDVVFTWNGTTGGTCVPDGDWIDDNRAGLTLCDATSAIFAYDMPWHKLDAVTWSWQKLLGGEAAHGMLVLSPRAVMRLEYHTPAWPMPKLFRLTKHGKLLKGVFEGATINTPSMLCVADLHYCYDWLEGIGGNQAMCQRAADNLKLVEDFVATRDWVDFLCKDSRIRSRTSLCLVLHSNIEDLHKKIVTLLEKEGVGFDFGSYAAAPAGLRLWGGGTVEKADLAAFLPWLDWAYAYLNH